MSQAIALRFIDFMGQNAAVRDKVKQAGSNMDALLKIAQEQGYHFSAADYQAATKVMAERKDAGQAPLSDDDLDNIAGGGATTDYTCSRTSCSSQANRPRN